jgi:hypothetical protein
MALGQQQYLPAVADHGETLLDHVHIVRRDRALALIAAKVALDADAVFTDEVTGIHHRGGHDQFSFGASGAAHWRATP